MDKQIVNIKRFEDGTVQLKDGRIVTPRNRVITISSDAVELVTNHTYLTYIDTEDYCKYSLYTNTMRMDHADIRKGVVAVDDGYSHRSVAALIMQTKPGQRVGYKDKNKFNLRKSNLYIIGQLQGV